MTNKSCSTNKVTTRIQERKQTIPCLTCTAADLWFLMPQTGSATDTDTVFKPGELSTTVQ